MADIELHALLDYPIEVRAHRAFAQIQLSFQYGRPNDPKEAAIFLDAECMVSLLEANRHIMGGRPIDPRILSRRKRMKPGRIARWFARHWIFGPPNF